LFGRHLLQALERLGERLAWRSRLGCVLPAAAQAVMLLGDVRQLEVQRERAQDFRLVSRRERAYGGTDGADVARAARVAGEQPDPLLGLEDVAALLLDQHRAQGGSEQADVAPEWGVGSCTCVLRHGCDDTRRLRSSSHSTS